jgi:prepilin-type processing-associated H-X9-DG protein
VKQLTIAAILYTQDYDGHFPGWVKNPDGRLAHNVWDEQIASQVKSPGIYHNEQDGPGIRSYADPTRRRVISYGLNGLLITRPKTAFDGRADFRHAPAEPAAVEAVPNPAETILFAEMVTREALPVPFGRKPDPVPATFGPPAAPGGRAWQNARDGWIDISPRDFVENTPAPGCFDPERWNPNSGIARAQWGGGGNYGFVDGHVKFMKLGQTLRSQNEVPVERYWSADNEYNLWNPNASDAAARDAGRGGHSSAIRKDGL